MARGAQTRNSNMLQSARTERRPDTLTNTPTDTLADMLGCQRRIASQDLPNDHGHVDRLRYRQPGDADRCE